jgi:hypothetical protein
MRLTAELIQNSLSYLNPLKERELDLRGAYCEKNMILHFEASWVDIESLVLQVIKSQRLRI